MKNKKSFVNKSTNMKILGAFLLGIMISITSSYVIAETLIKSENVSYVDNSNLKATNVQAAIDGTCTKFSNDLITLKSTIINEIYPVGSIYISYSSTNPSSFLGGTWDAFGKGQTLVGIDTAQTEFNTVGKTGGEKTHKLTIDETPSGIVRSAQFTVEGQWSIGAWTYHEGSVGQWMATIMGQHPSYLSGSYDKAHNNLQPYITVYMWKRTK